MKTIVLADDEADLRSLLQMTLEDPGYRLLEASDGDLAWDLILAECPDLVILDWMMPKKNGSEVAQAMKAHPRTRTIPIIMLTANDRGKDQQDCEGIELYAYLIKPFSPLQLLEKVRGALQISPL